MVQRIVTRRLLEGHDTFMFIRRVEENINEGSRKFEHTARKYPDGEVCQYEKLLRKQAFPGY